MKIKGFLWQAFQNRIQSADLLRERGWAGSEYCSTICDCKETVDQFFGRVVPKFIWCCVREASFGMYVFRYDLVVVVETMVEMKWLNLTLNLWPRYEMDSSSLEMMVRMMGLHQQMLSMAALLDFFCNAA